MRFERIMREDVGEKAGETKRGNVEAKTDTVPPSVKRRRLRGV